MGPFSYAGVRIIESEYATALPDKKPITEDMRAMVEHMHRLGLIQRRPAAFKTPQGMVVHPDILAKLRASINRQFESAFFYGSRP